MELEQGFVETNGIRLHVVQAGPQSGVPVVLLDGFPEHWRCWTHQIPVLAEAGFRVIVPDQRGYNLSDKPKGIRSYRVQELVQDVIGLIDSLEYEKVNLVGHGWGGAVAWSLAISEPACVDRLVILNLPHPNGLRRELARNPQQRENSEYARRFQQPDAAGQLSAAGLASSVRDEKDRQGKG